MQLKFASVIWEVKNTGKSAKNTWKLAYTTHVCFSYDSRTKTSLPELQKVNRWPKQQPEKQVLLEFSSLEF